MPRAILSASFESDTVSYWHKKQLQAHYISREYMLVLALCLVAALNRQSCRLDTIAGPQE